MIVKLIKKVYSFLRYNKNRYTYIKTLFLSAYYRMIMLVIPMNKLKKSMGELNEETSKDETEERYKEAKRISYMVNRVCDQTPWESKCLVRALTIQHLLKRKNIPSTLYLGVGEVNDKMIAHAWIRSGKYYLSGGNGYGYAVVAKFRA